VRVRRMPVLQESADAHAAGGLQKGLQLVQRPFGRLFFLCKKVRAESGHDGLFSGHGQQFFHGASTKRDFSRG